MLAASRVAPAAACAGSHSWQEAAVHLHTDTSMCAQGRQQQVASSSTGMRMQIRSQHVIALADKSAAPLWVHQA